MGKRLRWMILGAVAGWWLLNRDKTVRSKAQLASAALSARDRLRDTTTLLREAASAGVTEMQETTRRLREELL